MPFRLEPACKFEPVYLLVLLAPLYPSNRFSLLLILHFILLGSFNSVCSMNFLLPSSFCSVYLLQLYSIRSVLLSLSLVLLSFSTTKFYGSEVLSSAKSRFRMRFLERTTIIIHHPSTIEHANYLIY